jgi:ribosome-associated translation inhibitor RaiA
MEQRVREPTTVVRGDVPDAMVVYAHEKLLAVVAHASLPVLDVELRLDHHTDPARERSDHVEMTIDLDGTPMRAHGSAPTMAEAVDCAVRRLGRRVDAARERPQSQQLRHRDLESWHHGDRPTERAHIHPRPAEDRMLVRRKTFALHAESIEEALYDLETLDHDFFSSPDETNGEAVVYRVGDGYGLMQRLATPEAITRVEIPLELGPHPASTTLENALAILDETDAPSSTLRADTAWSRTAATTATMD